jgi:hypothetical protein
LPSANHPQTPSLPPADASGLPPRPFTGAIRRRSGASHGSLGCSGVRLPRQATLLQWDLESPESSYDPRGERLLGLIKLQAIYVQLFRVVRLPWARARSFDAAATTRGAHLATGPRRPSGTPERWTPPAAATPLKQGARRLRRPGLGGSTRQGSAPTPYSYSAPAGFDHVKPRGRSGRARGPRRPSPDVGLQTPEAWESQAPRGTSPIRRGPSLSSPHVGAGASCTPKFYVHQGLLRVLENVDTF